MTTITIPRAVVEQALEALEAFLSDELRPYEAAKTAANSRAALAQQEDVGLLEYRGNSVAFIHQKMTAYRAGIEAAWDAFRANGMHPDGKTSLADMIAKHTAPPQQPTPPLTIERLRYALVASRIVPPAAVTDPDGYDDGATLERIEALHRRIT